MAVGVLAFGVVFANWMFGEPEIIARARQIRVGMDRSEVIAIMGPSSHGFRTTTAQGAKLGSGLMFGPTSQRWLQAVRQLETWFGRRWAPTAYAWLVQIHFDERDRVSRIRLGDEVITSD